MSTRVTPDEYSSLLPVPYQNYRGVMFNNLGPCDLSPAHGRGNIMLQTEDHRAIVLCGDCYQKILREA